MENQLFTKFAPLLRELPEAEFSTEIERPQRLLIDGAAIGDKRVEVAYAPFDHVNADAKIVIVGITPGRQQMRNALTEARRILRSGCSELEAMSAAKVFASFSGPMRANLVTMLDSVGVHNLLKLASTASLWNGDARLAHFTSALRYPIFIDGENYSGSPSMVSTPILRKHLLKWFGGELSSLPKAMIVPLGPKVTEAVELVAQQVGFDPARILSGLPHPSGANGERIAFFLGRKTRAELSNKVEPERLIAARGSLTEKIAAMRQ